MAEHSSTPPRSGTASTNAPLANLPAHLATRVRPCGSCGQWVAEAVDQSGKGLVWVSAADEPSGNLTIWETPDRKGLLTVKVTRRRAAGMRASGLTTHFLHALTCTHVRDWYKGTLPSKGYAKR